MMDKQKQELRAKALEFRNHVEFWGYASGFYPEFMIEMANGYLAYLEAKQLGFIRAEDAALLPFERAHTCVEVAVYSSRSFDTDQPVYTAPQVPIALPRINHPAQFDYADKVAEVLKANGLKVVGYDYE